MCWWPAMPIICRCIANVESNICDKMLRTGLCCGGPTFPLRGTSLPQSPQHNFLKPIRCHDPGSDNQETGSCLNLFSSDHLRSCDIVLHHCLTRDSAISLIASKLASSPRRCGRLPPIN